MEVQGIVTDSPDLPQPKRTGRGNHGELRKAINSLTPTTVLVIHNASHNERAYLYHLARRAGKRITTIAEETALYVRLAPI